MAKEKPVLTDVVVVVPLICWTACIVVFIATWDWAWAAAAGGWQVGTLALTKLRHPEHQEGEDG